MTYRKHILALLAITIPHSAVAAEANKEHPPNIVYLFADQMRASATGYSGNPDVKTPNLDRLAQEGVNFRNTVAACPVCTPYRAALLTGRFPTTTGMMLNDLYLPAEELTMAEILAEAGYTTGYIGKWHLDGHGRHAFVPPERRQGWQFWKAAECDHRNYQSHYFSGDSEERQQWQGYDVFAKTRAAQAYVREHANGEKPFVLMISYGPPHPSSHPAPRQYRAMYSPDELEVPPNVPAEKRAEAQQLLMHYYAHCTALDKAVGDLLETLRETGVADRTLFVFTSDHGGMLWSHDQPQHWKQVPWSESSHVPFLLHYPPAQAGPGQVIDTPMTTTDILPTLLGLSGVEIPDTIEGDNLSPLVREGRELPDRVALYMSVTPFGGQGDPYRAIRTNNHTFVRSLDGPWLLFDDQEDPYQLENLLDHPQHAELAKHLDQRLQAELDRIGDDFRHPDSYLKQWGYQVDGRGAIEYSNEPREPQSPQFIANQSGRAVENP